MASCPSPTAEKHSETMTLPLLHYDLREVVFLECQNNSILDSSVVANTGWALKPYTFHVSVYDCDHNYGS